MATEYRTLANETLATSGVDNILAVKNGSVVRKYDAFFNVKDFGATGDGATNDTSAVSSAVTALRTAGGGTLYFPTGTYLIDSIDWDYMSGGSGKFVLQGSGSGTTLKKRVDNDATFITIGRDDTTNTFNGVCVVKDICIDGISGGGETVLSLWTLTTTNISNVRVRYGSKAVSMTNCVTVVGLNLVGASSGTGLYISKYVFGDATTSAANLLTFVGGAFKDNTVAGIDYNSSSEIVLVGTQIENNGTAADTATAGVFIRSTAGDAGVYRKAVALTAIGTWFENNKGLAAVVLSGGTNSFTGCHFVANADATRDLYSDGGLYSLINCSMPTGRTGGPIEDASGSIAGNLIIGGELSGSASVNEAKTDIISSNVGTTATPTRVFRRKGKTFLSTNGTTELLVQTGVDSSASGSTVTFPTAFAATPVTLQLTVMGSASNKIINAKAYNLSSTGFTIEKTSMTSGSSTISTTSDTVRWMAIGEMA